MKQEIELWQFIAEHLSCGQNVMLLVVTKSAGSSPGRQGFKMAVAGDGLTGSIGGGVMEVSLVELAKLKIQDSNHEINSDIIEQNHKKTKKNASGMICSGKQTIVFFKLNPQHSENVREILHALKKHQPKVLHISNIEFEIKENDSDDLGFRFEQTGEDSFIYEEKLGYKNKLYIVGGGHCALALSELMSKMDFYISLFDDREDLNTLDKNEFVNEKSIIESYENIGEFIESGQNIYVVVMTLGYKFDEIVIRKLFDKNFKYFGVLGSLAKMRVLLKTLKNEGFAKERLARIHTPIGLPINSRTPIEIAVSIAAEIIAVKNA